MTWNEVISDPSLSDLPYKIELNREGNIVMSPASNNHAHRQSRIFRKITQLSVSGEAFVETSIDTDEGTKVADVVWMSDSFYQAQLDTTPYPIAPELCVEVVSPSNSRREMALKRKLYFAQGAKEVWFSKQDGGILFYNPEGEIVQSQLFPDFPKSV